MNTKDELEIGQEVGDYIVDAKIGEGGMGSVYRVFHKRVPGQYFALKLLKVQGETHATARERFEQEARVVAAIGRERVAGFVNIGELANGTPYIVMNLIEGQSLAAMLEETGPMRVLTALRIAYHIADTLVVAHGKQIVHRDIKPSNIMVTRTRDQEFSVTILDWGIAKARGEVQVAHTGTAGVVGTPYYMAPETLLPKVDIDGRADVFSLAVTLFEMLSGRGKRPYLVLCSAADVEAAISTYRNQNISIGLHRTAGLDPVPRWLERTILKALVLEREDRPTMDKFRQDLADAMDRLQRNPENRPLADDDRDSDAPVRRTSSPSNQVAQEEMSASDAPPTQSPSSGEKGLVVANGRVASAMPQPSRRKAVGFSVILLTVILLVVGTGGVLGLRSCLSTTPDKTTPSDLAASGEADFSTILRRSEREFIQATQPDPPPPKPVKRTNKCKRNPAGALICP